MRSRYGKVCPTIRRQLFLLLATFSIGFFTVTSAHAATYYVATNGSDSNPGTEGSPWRTIEHAADTMVAGDTTYVKGGVYNERIVQFKKSGTESAPIRLLNAPGESPVIDFASSGDGVRFLNAASSLNPIGWIVLEGFEIRNGSVGIWFSNAHDIVIRHNWVHQVKRQGVSGIGKNILFDSNVVSQNGGRCINGMSETDPTRGCNQFHGMYITGSNWTITNNLVYDNLASGIQVAGYPWCDDGNCYGGGSKTKADPTYAGAANWLIANNTFAYNNYGPGLMEWQGAVNNRIVNNIFYENGQQYPPGSGGQGIAFWTSGGGHAVQNNLFYATAPGGITPIGGSSGWQTKYTESGSINANPNFINAPATLISGSLDFHLQPGSPAIDAGLAIPGMTSNDPNPDIGASDTSGFAHPVTNTSSGGGTNGQPPRSVGLGNCFK